MRKVQNGRPFGDGFKDAPLHQCLAISLVGLLVEKRISERTRSRSKKDETRTQGRMLGGVHDGSCFLVGMYWTKQGDVRGESATRVCTTNTQD